MAAATTAAAAALSMKLLIDRKAQRVLFAEASKEVVDFLFSLLALPVATAVKLVGKDAMVGCVGNLYASVDRLDATYVQPGAAKNALLSPTVLSPAGSSNSSLLRLPAAPSTEQPKTFYRCTNSSSSCRSYITDSYGKACPNCSCSMSTAANFLPSSGSGSSGQAAQSAAAKGFVQGIVTYTVLDNLTVTPMSAISSITLLNAFAVKEGHRRSPGEDRAARLQRGGLAILKPSLQSKTVLTDVFLAGNNKSPARGRA
ncbi:unnamed protein product [Urochloa decumbens]|uniref:DUF674 family protein n=1 Tax=Urochloa decumbens TaxID=240449 RepID=A0ABC8YXV9_9POAL